ncbi:perlucin-like [Wyeomyia smithii]|uniref:perlucin-like n=1 Tax=Wyeomyia smithii TaxID=174621 RepID=UPI0024680210|nr:perlucin-like [Wyeomyia smithii]
MYVTAFSLSLPLIVATSLALNANVPATRFNKYVVINTPVTYFEAWRGCQYYGQQLASITTREENEILRELLSKPEYINHTYWIAGTDIGREGQWVWITSNEPVVLFTNWGHVGPDDSNIQDCMTVGQFADDRTLWDDVDCEKMFHFICERIPRKPVSRYH